MKNFNDGNLRCLVLFLNLIILFGSSGSELTNGNFGSARPSTPSRTAAKTRKETTKTSHAYPYFGILESVDPNGKFITLKGKSKNRRILLNSQTKYIKDDQSVALDAAVPGARITGSVRKNDEGHEEAISVRFGEKVALPEPHKKLPLE